MNPWYLFRIICAGGQERDFFVQEMAEVLGVTENYVGVKLNRIRQQLAEKLKGACDEI